MQHEETTVYPSREQRLAWDILRNSVSMRLLGVVRRAYWPLTTRDHLESVEALIRRLSDEALRRDPVYFRARSEEERRAAARAATPAASKAHRDLADLHGLVANAVAHRRSREQPAIERREALLDDALDDTFPASDPPAILMPRVDERTH